MTADTFNGVSIGKNFFPVRVSLFLNSYNYFERIHAPEIIVQLP